jgi:signal peptidase
MQDKEVLMKKTSTRTNRWFQVLSTVLCILITFFCLYVIAISIHEKKTGTPHFILGWKPVLVLSGSMEPTIPKGALMIVREQTNDPVPGDIILFQIEEREKRYMVAHRFLRKEGSRYITKGDYNETEDPGGIKREDILGTVIYVPFVDTLEEARNGT